MPELMDETGMSRPWVYQRLQELARAGQVTQVSRGRWRAATGPPSVIVYVYVSRARLHVKGRRQAVDNDADDHAPQPPRKEPPLPHPARPKEVSP